MTRITITLSAAQHTPQWAESFAEAHVVDPTSWTLFSLGCRHGEDATTPTDALAPPASFDFDQLSGIAFDAGRLALLRQSPLHMRSYLDGFDQGFCQRTIPADGSYMWAQTCQTCGIRYAAMCTASTSGFDYTCVCCGSNGSQRLLANPTGSLVMRLAAQGAFGNDAPDNPGYDWLVDRMLAKTKRGRDWLDQVIPMDEVAPLIHELAGWCKSAQNTRWPRSAKP